MIMNDIIREILKCKPDDEIVIANQEEYFSGTPQYKEVCDVVKETNRLIILIK